MGNRIDTDEIKRNSSLKTLIETDTDLKPTGPGELIGLCPFHVERTPSFRVFTDPEDQHYHCHGCGEHGDIFDYLGQLRGLAFLDAVKFLLGEAGSLGPRPSPLSVAAERAPSPYEGVSARRPVPDAAGKILPGSFVMWIMLNSYLKFQPGPAQQIFRLRPPARQLSFLCLDKRNFSRIVA